MRRSERWEKFISTLSIRTSERNIQPLVFNAPQQRVWEQVREKIDHLEPIRLVVLKARREGISTLVESLLMTFISSGANVQALITAHQKKPANKIWSMSKLFVTQSQLLKKMATIGNSTITIGRSTLEVATAGSPESERGGDLTAWHACVAPNSPVVLADGRLVPISDVRVGDRLRTHTGILSTVRCIWSRPAAEVSDRGQTLSIRVWNTAIPLEVTPEHKCWTTRGWIEARHLIKGDELGTPIRHLSEEKRHLPIQKPVRAGSRGRQAWQDDVLPLNRETGFFFGYYVAEGYIKRQYAAPHRPCQVGFSAHASERAYGERAIQAVAPWATSWASKRRVGPQTLVTSIYGRSLAELVAHEFGAKDSKRIPDWVFDAPREFLEGLLEGYICGDGSKGTDQRSYFNAAISITSVRPSLLIQTRNILASLGWGWASLYRRNAETFVDARGWTNRPAWMLVIAGRPALRLRASLGWLLPPDGHQPRCHRQAQEKYRIDGSMLWARVKTITSSVAERVFDLEVDHADHSFESLQGAVANSEAAFYPHPEVMTATMQSLPQSDKIFSIGVIESTANGMEGDGEDFYDEWNRAEAGESEWLPLFLAWHTFPDYSIDHVRAIEDADEEEKELRMRFELTDGQLAWRRWAIRNKCKGRVQLFRQEYPATSEEAFIQSGLPFFQPHELLWLDEYLHEGMKGTIDSDGHFRKVPDGYVEVFKFPEPGHTYVIGADSSMGMQDRDDRKQHSRSAACVMDMETMEQVAEYDAASAPHIFARHLVGLGRMYNNGLLAPEVQSSGGGGGREVLVYVRDLGYWHIHQWRGDPDKIRRHDSILYGWECVSPSAKILTADLRWVEASQIKVGDRILGCREAVTGGKGTAIRMRLQTVTERQEFYAPTLEVTLANGQQTQVSTNHPFLVFRETRKDLGWRWIQAEHLRPGDCLRHLPMWETDRSYEAGRLSGLLDGEGHLSRATTRGGYQLLVTQAEGPLAEEIAELWHLLGFTATFKWLRHKDRPQEQNITTSGVLKLPDVLRALGSLRPTRLLRKFDQFAESGILTLRSIPRVAVRSIRSLGEDVVVGLTTDPDHTLIADGIVGHNTNSKTRPRMLARIREVVMEKCAIIHSRRLFKQLSAFGEDDHGHMEALAGRDDLLFSFGIALMSRSENWFVMPKYTEPNPAPIDWASMGIHVLHPESSGDRLRRLMLPSSREPEDKSFLEL